MPVTQCPLGPSPHALCTLSCLTPRLRGDGNCL